MSDKTSPGSAGHGRYRVTPGGVIYFDPQGGDGEWATGMTETRLRGVVRDAAGVLWVGDLSSVAVTKISIQVIEGASTGATFRDIIDGGIPYRLGEWGPSGGLLALASPAALEFEGVAGGGQGGNPTALQIPGGGGGGRYFRGFLSLAAGVYEIAVGAGGLFAVDVGDGIANGGPTMIALDGTEILRLPGGGYGGGAGAPTFPGGDGGSGGGGGMTSNPGGSAIGTTGVGHDGGASFGNNAGGGGGGAAAPGGNATGAISGAGGGGIHTTFAGSLEIFGGGGEGGHKGFNVGGGVDGGGLASEAGLDGTGAGGGGGRYTPAGIPGGRGGAGAMRVRWMI